MQLNKLSILILFLLIKFSVNADIALPKMPVKPAPNTKYYFANVDSFSQYKFFVSNVNTNKTVKIKQSAAFVLNSDTRDENRLDVWAIDKKTNQKTNVFSLTPSKNQKPQEYNTVYIAISFFFDKAGKLNYKQTVLKTDCYSKKQSVPFFTFSKPTGNSNKLFIVTLISFLILISIFFNNKLKLRKMYV